MFQIDNSTAAGALKTPKPAGTPGFFTSGDPGLGVPATIVDDDFMNMIMLEMINVVQGAGLIPNKENYTQLLTSIQQIAAQAANNYWQDSGTTDIFVIAPDPAVVGLSDGEVFRFKALNANTGAATITINALSPITIVRNDGTTLEAGDIPAGGIATIAYDLTNTRFLLQSVNASANQIQAQTGNGADDTGAANAYAVTLNPALFAHTKYLPIRVRIANTNTGASTFNPGPGTKPIVARDGSDLVGGELVSGSIVEFFYDGASYQYDVSLQVATNSQTAAGADTSRAVSPAGLASVFGNSLGASGYQKLPGGLILQWGETGQVTVESDIPITFPIPFPNACRNLQVTAHIPGGGHASTQDNIGQVKTNTSKTGAVLMVDNATVASISPTSLYWFAVGD